MVLLRERGKNEMVDDWAEVKRGEKDGDAFYGVLT